MLEENKTIARRFFDLFHGDETRSLEAVVAEDFIHHSWPWASPGIAGAREMKAMVEAALSDYKIKVEDVIAEDDKVVLRISEGGVHTGDLLGTPATGKRFQITAIHILRIENGKIAEHWREQDTLGAMQQLGVVPVLGE